MMEIIRYVLAALCAYMLGSMSVSIFISKSFLKNDVRGLGSGNAGATNMARVFGLRMGVVTLLVDMLKAALATLIGWLLAGEWGLCVAGVACILGHCFPVLHEFRGGKGVSVGAALLLIADWRVILVAAAFFALAAVLSKKVSLGSLAAAVTAFASAAFFGIGAPRLIMVSFAALMVVLRHRENIIRLIKGTEPDFKPGGTAKADKAKGAKLKSTKLKKEA